MKVTAKREEGTFDPIILETVIETQAEFNAIRALCQMEQGVTNFIANKGPQVGVSLLLRVFFSKMGITLDEIESQEQ